MILKNMLLGLNYKILKGQEAIDINKVCYDNRKVSKGDIFICIKGLKVDGHSFIQDVIKKGVKAIIVEENVNVKEDITVIKVENTRIALAKISSNYFGNPKDKLKIIGITGTNGKTTSAFIMKSILEKAGQKVGVIGTIANYIGNKKIDAVRTTPESYELHELFKNMVDEGVKYCIMEVSSHSLELNRVYGINFRCGIFTNLTRDHIDFHKTFENYYRAKFKLFQNSIVSIVNIDDRYGKRVVEDILNEKIDTNILTFSLEKESNFKAQEIKSSSNGSEFNMLLDEEIQSFKVNIPGLYNVYNILGCIICAKQLGISIENIRNAIKDIVIPGRCEKVAVDRDLPYTIIVDYAHTPDGLEKILKTVGDFVKGKIITVFGCGGDRDKIKRPQMGEIACKYSDISIVTSDNPRTEEPMSIINDIVKDLSYSNFSIEENRYKAIEKAIKIAKADDIIIIAGKGHETYQILKDKTIHFDEREVVYDILDKK